MAQLVCPHCGNSNPDDSIFCESCGKRISNDEGFYSGYDNKESVGLSKCPKCGCAIDSDSVFCEECGAKIVDSLDTEPIENRNADESNDLRCPSCGKPIYDDSVFCEVCGTKISLTSSDSEEDSPIETVKEEVKKTVLEVNETETFDKEVTSASRSESSLKINMGKSSISNSGEHQNDKFKPMTGFDD